VELSGPGWKYLRLSWPRGQPALELTRLEGRLGSTSLEPQRRWKVVSGTPGDKPGEYVFDVGGHFPVDRLTPIGRSTAVSTSCASKRNRTR